MPQMRSVFPLLDEGSKTARRDILDLARAAAGGDDADAYPARLDRLAQDAAATPDGARRLLEAAATLLALAVGVLAVDDIADFVRELDDVDFAIEADVFARSVDEMLANPALTERPDGPLGGFPS